MKRFVIILMALAVGLPISAQQTCPDDNHPHAIDLGLPSGTKWACCNVGASKPTAYGNYYAWGETTTKANYDLDTYKWCKSKWNSEFEGHDYFYTKYCTDSEKGWNGFTDNKTTLDLEDDAAHANWGGEWCMPDDDDFGELIEHTTNKWVENFNGTGVNGYLFSGKNGKRIFLPAAGYRDGTSLYTAGSGGGYWSSSLDADDPYYAYGLYFGSGYVYVSYNYRNYGHTVRPVRP